MFGAAVAAAGQHDARAQAAAPADGPAHVLDRSPHQERFVTANGARLQLLDWGGRGPVLLFLPGFGGGAHIFDDLAPAFTDRYHVLALTPRGFPPSDAPALSAPDSGYTIAQLAADVRAVLDTLGAQRAVLAGHSISGAVITRFAEAYPDRLRAAVYLDAAFDFAAADRRSRAARSKAPSPPADTTTARFRAWRRQYPDWGPVYEVDARMWDRDSADVARRQRLVTALVTEVRGRPHEPGPVLARAGVPALAVCAVGSIERRYGWLTPDSAQWPAAVAYAQADRRAQRATCEAFRRAGPQNRGVPLESGHFVFVDRRDAVVNVMRRFLSDVSGRATGPSHVVVSAAPLRVASIAARARRLYFDNRPDSALALFRAAADAQPADAVPRAWVAEAALRAGDAAEAARASAEALRLDGCNAQAHLVRASLFMPRYAGPDHADADSVWAYLGRAVRCDPRDGNAWAYVWKYAVMRRDPTAERRALVALASTGFLTRPQLVYAEWLLRSLPPRAVLVTGGDLDTYAPLAVQAARGVRPDVAVVNAVMLSGAWYAEPVLARAGLSAIAPPDSGPGAGANRAPPAERIVAGLRRQAAGAPGLASRPVAFALTVPVDTTSREGALQLAGPYWLVVPPGAPRADQARVTAALRAADASDWRGPAVAPSDRSPMHHLAERPPVLTVARAAILATALAPPSAAPPVREARLRRLLERAKLGRGNVEQALADLRQTSGLRTTSPLPSTTAMTNTTGADAHDANDVRAGARAAYARWFAALEAGDADAAAAALTADVEHGNPAGAVRVGREAVAAALRPFLAANTEQVRWELTRVSTARPAGTGATGAEAEVELREETVVRPRTGGLATRVRGTHTGRVRREQDGQWRIARDRSTLDGAPESLPE